MAVCKTHNNKEFYLVGNIPADSYLFKVNNGNTGKRCEICSKLTIKTPERRQWFLVSLLLTLNRFHILFWHYHCWLWTSKCQLGVRESTDQAKSRFLRDRFQISLLIIIREFKRINFYFPWNHQKTICFLTISGGKGVN